MPFTYTNVEYADIIYVYGVCDDNTEGASREYARRFPKRRTPHRSVFSTAFQHLRDTGTVPGVTTRAERVERTRGLHMVS